jgi:hypothetical protein
LCMASDVRQRRAGNWGLALLVLAECVAGAWLFLRTSFYGWLTATPEDSPEVRSLANWHFAGLCVSVLALLVTIGYWIYRARSGTAR